VGEESVRAKEFIQVVAESQTESLQLYVPRPKNINEILKPTSGFMYSVTWTSTVKKENDGYTSDWVEWCKDVMPQWLTDKGILYKVQPGARILNMNTDADAFAIAKKYGLQRPKNYSDIPTWVQHFPWDDIEDDYDGIHHVPTGSRLANMLMSSWDVESTAWFNKNHLVNLGEVRISL
jgi:hypothetical protein